MEALPLSLNGILAILLLSGFVKILTTLSILRFGLSLEGFSFGLAIGALAFVLAFVSIEPQFRDLGGLEAVFSGKLQVSPDVLERRFRPYLTQQSDAAILERLQKIASVQEPKPNDPVVQPSLAVLSGAYLISQLKSAFKLGLLFLVPFIVIDLIVVNVLMLLGIQQISHLVVALPLKLLLFISVDGWSLVTSRLLGA